MDRTKTDIETKDDASTATKPTKKPFTTWGQEFQKWSTYLSIDWGLNYFTGITFAAWGEFTKAGQWLWSKPMVETAEFISKNVFRFKGKAAADGALNAVRFMSVIAGGMFTIPPLMFLERKDVRKGMVKFYDEMHYGKDVVDNDPRFKEAYEAMDHEEKQGFWSGLLSRLASLAPLLAWVWVPFLKQKAGAQAYLDTVKDGSKTVYEKIGLTKERLFPGFKNEDGVRVPHSPKVLDKRWEELHKNSAMDFGLEPAYAILHMITYRAFAAMGVDHWFGGKKEDPKEVQKEVADEHAPKHSRATAPSTKKTEQTDKEKPSTEVRRISRADHERNVAHVQQLHSV